MPLLEYKCNDCGTVFEELVSLNDKNKIICPKCHSENSQRYYQGKSYQSKTKSGCSGSCKNCSGCK